MRAAFVARKGGPEVLEIRETASPEPGPGEVRIRVKTIGLNFADVLARLGVYTGTPGAPFIPGLEVSGVVEKTGAGVQGLEPGGRVMAVTRFGGHAEQVVVPAVRAVPIPETMSFAEAAAFPVNYLSAYHGIVTLARIQPGERLLLHAAAGGVGIATIQIARRLGAEVFGTAGSDEKVRTVLEQGAAHAINYTREDFAARVRKLTGGYGVDVVMDAVAGKVFKPSWRLLAPMGRYVIFGMASVSGTRGLNYLRAARQLLALGWIFPLSLVTANKSIAGFHLGLLPPGNRYLARAMKELLEMYADGALRPFVGATFPFDRIRDAHFHLQSRASIGKVVVEI